MELFFYDTIHISPPELWIVQMAHSQLIEDYDMEILKAYAPRTAAIDSSMLETEVVYFKEETSDKETTLTNITRAYINFNHNFIHVGNISEMFRFLRRPSDVVVHFRVRAVLLDHTIRGTRLLLSSD